MKIATGLVSALLLFSVGCGSAKKSNSQAAVGNDKKVMPAPAVDQGETPKTDKGVTQTPVGQKQAPVVQGEQKTDTTTTQGDQKSDQTIAQGNQTGDQTLAQGDVKQGDVKQGDVKQGDQTVAQGDVKQGDQTVAQGDVKQGDQTVAQGDVKQGDQTVAQGDVKQGDQTVAQGDVKQGDQTVAQGDIKQSGVSQGGQRSAADRARDMISTEGRDAFLAKADERLAALEANSQFAASEEVRAIRGDLDLLKNEADEQAFAAKAGQLLEKVERLEGQIHA